jgi:hypothetical protein
VRLLILSGYQHFVAVFHVKVNIEAYCKKISSFACLLKVAKLKSKFCFQCRQRRRVFSKYTVFIILYENKKKQKMPHSIKIKIKTTAYNRKTIDESIPTMGIHHRLYENRD